MGSPALCTVAPPSRRQDALGTAGETQALQVSKLVGVPSTSLGAGSSTAQLLRFAN
jgi:hypothetical protein